MAKAQSHHQEEVKTRLELKKEQQEKAFELKAKAKQANYKADTLKKQQAEERKAKEDARLAAEKKAKAEEDARLAAEKKARAEEELEKEKAAKAADLKVEQERQEISQQTQASNQQSINSNANTSENTGQSQQTQEAPVQQIARTDGFNFNGNHYDIGSFSGVGQVPASSLVYQWADYTAHLHILVERLSVPGGTIRQLAIGSKLTINGNTYTVFNERNGVINGGDAYASLSNGNPAVTIQVCDSADPHSTLTIWYAS